MAEPALGLAKSVVEGTLVRAKSAIEEELKQRESLQNDLVFITREFVVMQRFLNVANDEGGAMNELVRSWVTDVRDLAYDVEDGVELAVHIEERPRWVGLWRMIPAWMAPTRPLDEAVAIMRDLKERVEETSQRYMRYNYISNTGSQPAILAAGQTAAPPEMLAEASDALKKASLGDLLWSITKDVTDLQVVSVWGTGGEVGRTSVIRGAYNAQEMCQIFGCRGWARLTHPFSLLEFFRSLLTQFHSNSCLEQGTTADIDVLKRIELMAESPGELLEEFLKQVNKMRYLVVLEDVSMVVWDTIRAYLPDMKNGSRIIVSTELFEIATLYTGHPYQVSVIGQISTDHSVYILEKKDDEGENLEAVDKLTSIQSLRGRASGEQSLFGRDRDVTRVQEMMTWPGSVISVWGFGGVGKSALVRKVYNSIRVNDCYRKTWVNVSYPFSLTEFSRSLLLNMCPNSLLPNKMAKDPIRECSEIFSRIECLVVIDGLQSIEEWVFIKACLIGTSTIIHVIIVTDNASVATHCADNGSTFNVKALEDEAARNFFNNEVTTLRENSGDAERVDMEEARSLLDMSGGLPKVIVALARHFVSSGINSAQFESSFTFMHWLQSYQDDLRSLFSWMHTSFRACPDDLKRCIFYLPIFPRGTGLRRMRLVMRWIAEGYSNDSHTSSAVENGVMLFDKLIDISIIQYAMSLYHVNRFFIEYLDSKPIERNFALSLEGRCSPDSEYSGRHLTIQLNWARDRIVFGSMDFSRLRSLTVFGNWKSFFISDKMNLLRVLDLEDASFISHHDVKRMVKLLPRLKFLSLRGRREVTRLPRSLGALRQLQTLDVRHTSIVKLPRTIIKLESLQYIRGGNTLPIQVADGDWVSGLPSSVRSPAFWRRLRIANNAGVVMPAGIGNLKALHTLGVANVNAAGGRGILKELKRLTQLRKLAVSGVNRDNLQEFFSVASNHSHLESLSVLLDKDINLDDVSIQFSRLLRSLKLYGPLSKFPAVLIKELHGLRKLNLELTMLGEEDIKVLNDLPNLVTLRLFVNKVQDGELSFYARCSEMVLLEVACRSSLHVCFQRKSMNKLEILKIRCSDGSSWKLSGLEDLKSITEVWLEGTYDQELRQELEQKLAKNQNKPVLRCPA